MAKEKTSEEILKEQNQTLQDQVEMMQELNNLNDQNYYRRQTLIMHNQVILQLERIAVALETSLKEENESVPEIKPKGE